MATFADLGKLSEDEQIGVVGSTASAGKSAGFILSDCPRKIERFLGKLKRRFPEVKVERIGLLTKGTVAFKATRAQN